MRLLAVVAARLLEVVAVEMMPRALEAVEAMSLGRVAVAVVMLLAPVAVAVLLDLAAEAEATLPAMAVVVKLPAPVGEARMWVAVMRPTLEVATTARLLALVEVVPGR